MVLKDVLSMLRSLDYLNNILEHPNFPVMFILRTRGVFTVDEGINGHRCSGQYCRHVSSVIDL